MMEKKIFYVSTYHVTLKEVENHIFRHNCIFRYACINKQPALRRYWNYNICVQILYSYSRYVFFLLLAAILSELYEKPRRNKDSVTEKLHRRICLRDITTFLTTRPPFYVICWFLTGLSPPTQVTYLLNDLYKDT